MNKASDIPRKPQVVRLAGAVIIGFLVVIVPPVAFFSLMLWRNMQSPYHYGKTPEGSISTSTPSEAARARVAVEEFLGRPLQTSTVVTHWRVEIGKDKMFLFRLTISRDEWTSIAVDGLGLRIGFLPGMYDYTPRPTWTRESRQYVSLDGHALFLPSPGDASRDSSAMHAWVVADHGNDLIDVVCAVSSGPFVSMPDKLWDIW